MKRWTESSLSESSGNAVVGAIANISFATLITLSILSLSLSAFNTLLIRDAAIDAAARAALPQSTSQQPYLMRLLDQRLPLLAKFEVKELDGKGVTGFRIKSYNPVLGFVQVTPSVTEVLVAKEQLPGQR
jgi:hypothetical protein